MSKATASDAQSGFTLIEIMLALAVFSFMALGMAYGMSMTIRNSGDSQMRQDIVMRIQNYLNSTDWAALCPAVAGPAVSATISLTASGSTQVLNITCANLILGTAPSVQTVQTVAATASWSERGVVRNVTVTR